MRRRTLLTTTLAMAVATSLAACGQAAQGGTVNADNWPRKGKPVELIVSFAPGGAVDTAARLVAPILEKELGTNVEVVNKPGAGGQIGYTALTSSKPDGYTIGATGSPSVVVSPLVAVIACGSPHQSRMRSQSWSGDRTDAPLTVIRFPSPTTRWTRTDLPAFEGPQIEAICVDERSHSPSRRSWCRSSRCT